LKRAHFWESFSQTQAISLYQTTRHHHLSPTTAWAFLHSFLDGSPTFLGGWFDEGTGVNDQQVSFFGKAYDPTAPGIIGENPLTVHAILRTA
jgi:hypothetical protein